MQHHASGRLAEAEKAYQQIVQADPEQPVALHLLGVIAHQIGKNDVAEKFITQAIANKPDYDEAHSNLGLVLRAMGQLDEAVDHCHKAIAITPDYAEAHNNLGITLQQLGRIDEALVHFHKAITILPGFAEAHSNSGNANLELGRLGEAVRYYRQANDIRPDDAVVHNKLGLVLRELGQLDEAITHCQKAVEISPDDAEAHLNLGVVLKELGRLDEAVYHCQKAIEIKPDQNGYIQLGLVLVALGRIQEASQVILTPITQLRTVGSQQHVSFENFHQTSHAKLTHDIEQLTYLASMGKHRDVIEPLLPVYQDIVTNIPANDTGKKFALIGADSSRLNGTYNRLLNYKVTSVGEANTLNPSLDNNEIEADFFARSPGFTTVDNILSEQTLSDLRAFCLESTIWYQMEYPHQVGASLRNGFCCSLLFQISNDLRTAFPAIFKDHLLTTCWGIRYYENLSGLEAHADDALVSMNLWITPEQANLAPASGGLTFWNKTVPPDFFSLTPEEKSKTLKNLQSEPDTQATKIPYGCNRATIFNSDVVHMTDEMSFKEGYLNRRINITFLFGRKSRV